jgi:Secretion system C-terminal sorting domain
MIKVLTSVLLLIGPHLFSQNSMKNFIAGEPAVKEFISYHTSDATSLLYSPNIIVELNAVGDYRSKQTGDWNLATTWERFDGSNWIAAATAPSNTDGAITILSAHTVTVNSAVIADQITVDAGATLTVTSTLALTDGNGDDLIVNGTINLNSGVVSNSGGSLCTVVINGTANWSGGNWTAINNLTVATGAVMNISGTASELSDGTLNNNGIINWSGGNILMLTHTLNNNSPGILNISGNNTIAAGTCGASPCPATFSNFGTVSKTSTGVSNLNIGNNYGTIKGVGTINCSSLVSKGGTISPGLSPGILTLNGGQLFNNFTTTPSFISASNFLVEIVDGSGAGTGHDEVRRAGSLTLGGSLTISETGTPPSGTYTLISLSSGTITGTFSSLNMPPGYLLSYGSTAFSVIKGTCSNPIANNTLTAPAVSSFCGSGDPAIIIGSTATGGSGIITYQWQQQVGTGIYTNIFGATSKDYDPPSISQTTNYRRLASTGSCYNYSPPITITITGGGTSAPIISAGGPASFCVGGSVTLSSSLTSGNQWYKDGNIIAGATNQTYVATTSGIYTCIVTVSGCSSAASNSIAVTVNAVPSAPTITAGSATTFCSGGSVTLSSSLTSGNQWYKDGNIIAGATAQTYSATTSGSYTCIVSVSGCSSPASNAIVVTVNAVPSAPTITAGSTTTFCSGGSVTLSSSSVSGNQWYKDGSIIAGSTAQTYSATTSGTYTSRVTTNGCQSPVSNSIVVTVNAVPSAPTITAGSATTFCSGGSVTLSSSLTSGNQWYKDGNSIAGATNQTYSATTSGTYTSRVTTNGCQSSASNSLVVTVNVIPTAPNITAGSATTFCNGGSVTLTSSIASGNQWYKDGNIIAGATNQTYSAITSGTYTSSVTTNGCQSSASNSIVITANPLPSTPVITASAPTTFCSGGTVTLSSNAVSGNQWYKDGNIIAGATAQTYSATTSGSYTCIVTASGCQSSASNAIVVTVNAVPSAPTITAGSTTTFCNGGNVILTSSSPSGNQWYKDGNSIAGATAQIYSATTSGSYTSIVTLSGCSSTASNAIVVMVNAVPSAPTITAESTTTFCSGGSVTFTSSSVSGNQWYKDGNIIAGATAQTYSATTSGTYTSRVTINGCQSPASNAIVVTVNSLPATPVITASGPTTFCSGGTVTLNSSSVSGNQWYKDGNIIAGATTQSYTTSVSGTYTVIVTNNGCFSLPSNPIVVTVNLSSSAPVITAGGSTSICTGNSVLLSSNIASGNQWYKDGNIIAGATAQTYSVTTSGSYTCIVTVSGCSSPVSNSIVVTVNAIPTAPTITAGSITTFCAGGSVTLSSSLTNGNQWYKDGNIIAGATVQTYSTTTSGTYTCRVTTNGCQSSASNAIVVTVNAIPSAPTITAGSATTFCAGGSVTLSSSSVSGNQWYKDGNTIAGATNQTYSATTSGTYTLRVTTNGCQSSASNAIVVTVNAVPSAPTITAGSATTFCVGGSVTLSSDLTSGNQWYKDGNIIAGATAQTYSVTISGSYTCIVTLSGCSSPSSNAIVVTVNSVPSAPTITAGSATTFCSGGSVTLTSSSVSGNQWYKDGNIIAGATNQTYAVTTNGTYAVIVSNTCSSLASNSIVVIVNAAPPKPIITLSGNNLQSSIASGNQWYKDGVIIAGATSSIYTPTASGNYSVTVTVNGCPGVSSDLFNYVFTAIPDIDVLNQQVKIFPNPVMNKLIILTKANTINQTIRLFDINGKQLLQLNNTAGTMEINMENFSAGLYILWVTDHKNKISGKKKIVKQ